jgi:signal transduction histidine kinase
MKLLEFLETQPKSWVLSEALLLVGTIGVVDYCLPFEFTLYMFYVCPILFAAWFGNRRIALAIAVVCAVTFWVANLKSEPFGIRAFTWATINRLVSFVVIAIGGSAMRAQRESMNAKLAAMERTRQLEEEIVRVSEREQMRIGQDLHDGLCQHLAAIDCAVACLKHDLEEKSLPEATAADYIQTQLSHAIAEARDMARGIFPVQIDDEGLVAALSDFIDSMNRLRLFSVTLRVSGPIKIKDPQLGMHLFRIAQEALNNVRKHAHATEASVDLEHQAETLVMSICDNGKGFSQNGATRGIGTQTMSYRVRTIGGQLEIGPGAGGGTRVCCTVPLAGSLN